MVYSTVHWSLQSRRAPLAPLWSVNGFSSPCATCAGETELPTPLVVVAAVGVLCPSWDQAPGTFALSLRRRDGHNLFEGGCLLSCPEFQEAIIHQRKYRTRKVTTANFTKSGLGTTTSVSRSSVMCGCCADGTLSWLACSTGCQPRCC